jgi:hypothetical protein
MTLGLKQSNGVVDPGDLLAVLPDLPTCLASDI